MNINQIKLDNNFKLVEASAGTGKSFTLAHLVLRNVLEKKIKPEEILLLSFTKNTCSELKDKILSRFNKLKSFLQNHDDTEIDDTLLEWYDKYHKEEKYPENIIFEIDNFVNAFYKLKVTTFHAFCNNILEEYSIDIGSPQDPFIENNIDNVYQDIVNDLWIEEFLNLDPEIISAVSQKKISSIYGSKINKSFFVDILKNLDQENICKIQITNKYKNINISNYLKEFLVVEWREFCNEWNNEGEELFLQLIELGKLIKGIGGKSQIYSSKPRNNKFTQINEWIEQINLRLDSEDISQLLYDISKEDLLFKYFYNKNINKEINKFNLSLDFSRFKLLQDKIYKIKEGIYTEFVRIFVQLAYLNLITTKKSLSIFNFNDLIKTVEYKYLSSDICNDRSFSDIQNKFKCVLVDEFQDTDNVQWNIINKFFNNKNHFLLCVGDPKQAIYKFRGGDIETYLDAKSSAKEVFSLINNYRSSNDLLDFINNLYKNGLKESNLNYKKLNSRIKNCINYKFDFESPFEIVQFSNKEIDIEQFVTEYIVDFLLNNQEIDINKISILTLYNSQCLELKNKLLKFNIPCQIKNKQNIFDTEASSLLLLFIETLLSPRLFRNISLLATSKFIEIDVEELIDHQISKKIKNLTDQCILWSLELREKGFLTVVNELIINYKSSSIKNEVDLYANLFQLSEIIEIELINNNFNLNKVFKWYQNQLDDSLRICTGEDYMAKDYNLQNGINLSTIHNSKGLEYDVVVCPYLSIISNKSKKTKGPIWKSNLDRSIYINISNNYSKVEGLKLIEERDLFKESERLIYVALTRSKYKLIIFNDIENTDNILNNDLLPNLKNIHIINSKREDKVVKMNIKEISSKFNLSSLNNNLWKINKVNTKEIRKSSPEDVISFSSYSSWIRKDKKTESSSSLYKDYEDNISILKTIEETQLVKSDNNPKYLNLPNPLSDFPKGTVAGTCLHKILERFDFQNDTPEKLLELIIEELNFFQIDSSFALKVREGIFRIINVSFGKKLLNKRLIDISSNNILKEVKYDLPLSYNGKSINSNDIAKSFLLDQEFEFGKEYATKINDLQILNKGFHSGCIDCVIPLGNTLEDSKWWVIDWKSNFISSKENSDCFPKNYHYENMKKEMIKHHYPLQAHLYLLALHRLLKWRLKNYQPNLHLGGYIYLFLKGLPDINLFEKSVETDNTPGLFISQAPINRISYLDNIFK
ncbi:possible UvrD/REP helicase subunit B [Prochlorococcus marinus str. MIT 9515]|uniref:DNA 3'-5' helicase n=1 Tax=Prochlorococcus marinus (strain MIT 9515) TaxID=167542 RepID=A2BX90_PROM5|nr:UvrD-helicase domain-containing protein [Prochlorococcus marinus]ABM72401.1 possible UvrD/REP helicase subunit B [Prochlorococcus marinus str. MIT 9515]